MRQHPRRFLRFGTAIAAALLLTAGLIPATSASAAGPAPAATPRASNCGWVLTPSRLWVTDPSARVSLIYGVYNRPRSAGVAYKVTGQFSHSTTMSFTSYDNLINIDSPAYVLNDSAITPDPGSVNPFVAGNRVMAPNRNYTVWFWPDNIPVPAGMKNVVLYATQPQPGSDRPVWSIALRMYHMQPGYSALAEQPKVTAVSAANPNRAVRCPLTRAGTIAEQVIGFFAHKAVYGAIPVIPEPPTGNKIYFSRFPAAYFVGLDGYPGVLPYGCANYLVATLPLNQVSVTTMHKVPEFFNNDLVTPQTVMKDYPIRYQSVMDNYFTINGPLYRSLAVNTDDSVYTAKGEWVTVWLPSEPRLSPSREARVRAAATALHYNVLQLPPKATGPIQSNIPDGSIALRQKGISPNFGLSNTNVPCWSEDHDYRTYEDQTNPAFFAEYASSPANNGPYYIDGYKTSYAAFMAKASAK